MQVNGAPGARANHSAVWTGTEMIIFGGFASGATFLNDLGRYNPTTNAWSIAAPTGTPPSVRSSHTAVWTGAVMIVYGGTASGSTLNNGGQFNPSTDVWTALPTVGAPATGRIQHTAVWSGTEMLVWGGYSGSVTLADGGRYNPSGAGSWTAMSLTGAPPSARSMHTAVWTGTAMLVWGGTSSGGLGLGSLGDGYAFTPGAGTAWTTLASAGAPSARAEHAAVWTGAEMIIWAGYGGPAAGSNLNDGGRYNAANNSWSPLTLSNAPPARYFSSAVWTGAEMLIYGGFTPLSLNDTWSYTPPKTLIMYQRP